MTLLRNTQVPIKHLLNLQGCSYCINPTLLFLLFFLKCIAIVVACEKKSVNVPKMLFCNFCFCWKTRCFDAMNLLIFLRYNHILLATIHNWHWTWGGERGGNQNWFYMNKISQQGEMTRQCWYWMDHPFKMSTFLRGEGVKNWPNLPTDSSKKTADGGR